MHISAKSKRMFFSFIIGSLVTGGVSAQIDEIIVTANKREQTLQEVPVAVSVVDATTIDQAHIEDMFDLQSVIPSFEARQYQNSTDATFFIRGYGNGSNNPGIEPSVAVYVDGVPRSRMQSQFMDLPNLERIEVLKGPQSTIFGKNSSSGVINIVTKKPSQDFEGQVKMEVGAYSAKKFQAYLNGGLSDSVAASLSMSVNKRDGYSETAIAGNKDVNDTNRKSVRADIYSDISDTLNVRFIADYSEVDELCCTVGNLVPGQSLYAVQALGGTQTPGNPYTYDYSPSFDPTNDVSDKGYSLTLEKDLGFATLTSITSDRTSHSITDTDIGFDSAPIFAHSPKVLKLENLTQEFRLTSNGDERLDWQVGAFYAQEDLYHEFRLTFGQVFRNYADILAGGNGNGAVLNFVDNAVAPFIPEGFEGQPSYSNDTGTLEIFTQDNESISIFAQVDYEVTEKLTATLGFSYFEDEKSVTMKHENDTWFSQIDLVQVGFAGAYVGYLGAVVEGYLGTATQGFLDSVCGDSVACAAAALPDAQAFAATQLPAAQAFAQTQAGEAAAFATQASTDPEQNTLLGFVPLQFLPLKTGFPNVGEDGKSSDDNMDYSIKLSYQLNEQVTLYGGLATGYKATQWNLSRDSNPTVSEVAALQASGWTAPANFTSGLRNANPEDGEVYELGAKMSFDKGSLNITYFDQSVDDFVTNTFVGAGFVLANAGQQSAKGLEFDMIYRPVENLSLAFSGLLIDSVYDSFVGAAGGDKSGDDVEGVHPESLSASATWNWSANAYDGFARIHYQYDSNVVIRPEAIATATLKPFGYDERSRGVMNASLGIENNGWRMVLWGRNLTNDEFLATAFPAVAGAGQWSGYPSEPRTWGLSLSKEF